MDDYLVPVRSEVAKTEGSEVKHSTEAKARVLLVDDEKAVLSALQRHLRTKFDLTLAVGGQAALDLLDGDNAPFDVLCTDMRMPGIDGVTVLKNFRDRAPETTRILLTGYADLDSAISAVNDGGVFRFLTKPTDPASLGRALAEGAEMSLLRRAERELLEHTLRGSIQALLEALSLANPRVFARALRIRNIVVRLLDETGIEERWEIEVAAMLAQLGLVTLPPGVIDKLDHGILLEGDEAMMVDRLPPVVDRLLSDIPRIEGVRSIIRGLANWKEPNVPVGTKFIRLAQDLEGFETQGQDMSAAVGQLGMFIPDYGAQAIAAAEQLQQSVPAQRKTAEIPVSRLREGMVLIADVKTADGRLLVGRGQTVTESLLLRIHNFASSAGLAHETLNVILP